MFGAIKMLPNSPFREKAPSLCHLDIINLCNHRFLPQTQTWLLLLFSFTLSKLSHVGYFTLTFDSTHVSCISPRSPEDGTVDSLFNCDPACGIFVFKFSQVYNTQTGQSQCLLSVRLLRSPPLKRDKWHCANLDRVNCTCRAWQRRNAKCHIFSLNLRPRLTSILQDLN